MGIGKTNKMMGSNAEKKYSTFFKELGFNLCEPSRFVSKKHDNAKIDLVNIPFNVQIKAGKQANMNPGKELLSMQHCVDLMFTKGEDPVTINPNILIHSLPVKKGEERLSEHEIVYMSLQQFDIYRSEGSKMDYLSLKEFKFELNSEFKTIVSVTLEVFTKEIILKHYQNGNYN
jgi:hypothetical protein